MKRCEITLHNQDCMEALREMEDNAFDLAIVDPPYGIGDKFKGGKTGKIQFNEVVDKGWDKVPDDEYFNELMRVSTNQIIWGGNYFPLIWSVSNSFIVWNKMQRDFSLADGELAWYSEKDKAMRIFDFSRGGGAF